MREGSSHFLVGPPFLRRSSCLADHAHEGGSEIWDFCRQRSNRTVKNRRHEAIRTSRELTGLPFSHGPPHSDKGEIEGLLPCIRQPITVTTIVTHLKPVVGLMEGRSFKRDRTYLHNHSTSYNRRKCIKSSDRIVGFGT